MKNFAVLLILTFIVGSACSQNDSTEVKTPDNLQTSQGESLADGKPSKSLQTIIKEQKIPKSELSIKIDNSIPDSLLGDAMRIKQIMSNLVSNAIKFTQHGSVIIDVTCKAVSAKRTTIKITVADTGIGMNSEQQKAIFKAFSQADQSITRLHGGTGLGLIISQRLAYEMKGDVGFSSRENNGSIFWFKFQCDVNTLPLSNELDTLRLANKTILYYEPHLHSRAATYDILLSWRMQVTQVGSISQLTEALNESKQANTNFDYALIGHDRNATALSDLKKIITQIKPQITNVHLAINSNSPSLQDALLANGAMSCLSKPVTAYKLYSALFTEQDNLSPPSRKILPIKVLAVDDNEANLKLINALLLEQVNEVVLADNGIKAFELCKNESFDLIFMDIQMPIMDGYESVKHIKDGDSIKHIPVFALTASAFKHDEKSILSSGFDGFLAKPFKLSNLFKLINDTSDIKFVYEAERVEINNISIDDLNILEIKELLTPEQIEDIDDLALINDFGGIKNILETFRDEAKLTDFVDTVIHLTDNFDDDNLQILIERLKG